MDEKKVPQNIKCKTQLTDAVFHTEKAMIAVADMAGQVSL